MSKLIELINPDLKRRWAIISPFFIHASFSGEFVNQIEHPAVPAVRLLRCDLTGEGPGVYSG